MVKLKSLETMQTRHSMKLITIKEAQDRLSVGRTTLWALCKRADFPILVELTAGRKAFVESEIND